MRSYVSGTGRTLLQFVGLRVEILGQPQAAFTLICAADCGKGAIPLGQFPELGGIAHSRFVPKLSQQKLFLSGEDALIYVNPGVEFGDEWMPAYVAVANQKIGLTGKRSPSAPPYPMNGAFAWAIRLAKSKSLIWITSVLCGMQYLKTAKLEAYAPGRSEA
jgi:hypothetical protein